MLNSQTIALAYLNTHHLLSMHEVALINFEIFVNEIYFVDSSLPQKTKVDLRPFAADYLCIFGV